MSDDIPIAQRQPALLSSFSKAKNPWRSWGWVAALVATGGILVLVLTWSHTPDPSPSSTTAVNAPSDPIPTATTPTQVLGHYAFAEAPQVDLQQIGHYHNREIKLRRSAAQQYLQMSAAARKVGVVLVPISGFRSVADQEYLFFRRAQSQSLRPEERALVSAPPGYSEHHTGYALDIGDGADPKADTQTRFESSKAFKWLSQNAARYGFELSFPRNNSQGVSYEPWHWRFVGDRPSLEVFYAHRSAAERKDQISTK